MDFLLERLKQTDPEFGIWLKNHPEARKQIIRQHVGKPLEELTEARFAVTIMTNTLPKYSLNREAFFEKQLPALLRITEREAYVYPYSIWQEDLEGNLQCTEALYEDPDAVNTSNLIAEEYGFKFDLRKPVQIAPDSPIVYAKGYFSNLSEDYLTEVTRHSVAVFTRNLD